MALSTEHELLNWMKRTVWMEGCDIETEMRQANEEGRDLNSVEDEAKALLAVPNATTDSHGDPTRGGAWFERAGALIDRIQSLPMRSDFSYCEPSEYEAIQKELPNAVTLPAWSGTDAHWGDKIHGALLGRICGCMLGKPIEGWSRESIRITAEATKNWPLQDYLRLPTVDEAAQIASKNAKHQLGEWHESQLKGGIVGMIEDDDINYTTIGFAIIKKYGSDFTPADVAHFWLDTVPILHTCTAERVAYRNFVSNVLPPQSAEVRNPYREWIGAQIRADYFGYANPGNPKRAAAWARRDSCISHVKNGIYGEMWVAAMIAAAAVCTEWETVILAGLSQIPAHCRLREDVQKIVVAHAHGASYDDAVEMIHAQWDETRAHDWCHTNPNAQIVVVGLLYGDDDFEKTITRSVMPGFDTDCSGATCGSLWGAMHGARALPEKWTGPMQNRVRTGVHGYHDVTISQLAADMLTTAIAVRE